MPEAVANPSGKWNMAPDATVSVKDGKATPNVRILRLEDTPAMVTISKAKYPEGVLILNETVQYPEADNADPIDTTNKPTFNLQLVPKHQEIIPVPMVANSGWPTGEIVLWEK